MEDASELAVLERLRQASGSATDNELAQRLDLSRQSIAKAKATKSVPAAWIPKASLLFGVTTDWLFFGSGPMRPGDQPEQAAQTQDAPMPIQEGTCAACADLKRELAKKNQQFDNAFEKLVEVSQEAMRLTEEVGQLRLENLKLTHQLETARQMCQDYASSAKNAGGEDPLFDEQQIILRSEPPRTRR